MPYVLEYACTASCQCCDSWWGCRGCALLVLVKDVERFYSRHDFRRIFTYMFREILPVNSLARIFESWCIL
jgi:hypothetical protein